MTDILLNSLTGRGRGALQKLGRRSLEADERGRIDAIGEVSSNRSDGRPIANTEAHRVCGVIEVLKVSLVKMQ